MSWPAFALCGPILWAISVHLDKYLVERYFKDADVRSADLHRADGPGADADHRLVRAGRIPARPDQHPADVAVRHFLHDRHHVLSPRLAGPRSIDGGAILPELTDVRLRPSLSRPGRDAQRHAARGRRVDHRRCAVGVDRDGTQTRAVSLAARGVDALCGLRAVTVDPDLQGFRV